MIARQAGRAGPARARAAAIALSALAALPACGVAAAAEDAGLYVPGTMEAGGSYIGMVRHSGPRDAPVRVELASSDPEGLSAGGAMVLEPRHDHMMFGLEANRAGAYRVLASVDGKVLEAGATVHDAGEAGKSGARLVVSVPGKTRTPDLVGAVHVVDAGGRPVALASPARIWLEGSPGIEVPHIITVPRGSAGATFDAHAAASGSITASGAQGAAAGAAPGRADITYEPGRAEVRLAAWPEVMPEDSAGHYFLWLERDGVPHSPRAAPAAVLHSSDGSVVRTRAAAWEDGPARAYLGGGMARGILYSGGAGVATITASVPGYGAAAADVAVGPAGAADMEAPPAGRLEAALEAPRPNFLLHTVVPPAILPGGEAYLATAAYHAEYGSGGAATVSAGGEVDVAGGGGVLSLLPVAAGPVLLHIASDGADHGSIAVLGGGGAPTNAGVHPITAGRPGTYAVSVAAPGMSSPGAATLEVAVPGPGRGGYRVAAVPLPALPGHMQDVALVHAADADGYAVDPDAVPGGRGLAVRLESDSIYLGSGFASLDGPVAVARGAPSGEGELRLSAAGMGGGSVRVGAHPAAPAPHGTVRIDAPDTVRAGEPFPAAARAVAGEEPLSGSVPLEGGGACAPHHTTWNASGSAVFSCSGPGTIYAFAGDGHASIQVDPYRSPGRSHVVQEFSGTARAGGEYSFSVRPVPEGAGHRVVVDTAVPHEVSGDMRTVTVRPDRAGSWDVVIGVSVPGTETVWSSHVLRADDSATYTVRAVDEGGRPLGATARITEGGGEPFAAASGHSSTVRGESVTVEFPRHARHGDGGYALVGVSASGGEAAPGGSAVTFSPSDGDAVTAAYERVVLVRVEGGGEGGGTYRPGQTVTISAPDRHAVSFLVRHVWDGWEADGVEGLDAPTSQFAAERDVVVTARYREDHTGAAAVFAAAGGALVAAAFRGDYPYRLRAAQALDRVTMLLRAAPKGGGR